jgi:O-methyltransferase
MTEREPTLGVLPALSPTPEDIQSFSSPINWGITDSPRFFTLLDEAARLVAPGYFIGDNLFCWERNNSWADDAAFGGAWRSNWTNPADAAIVWRRYILACAAYHCLHLEGDFVECGVYLGTGVKTVMDYLGGKSFPKTFWAYDTYDTNPTGHQFAGQEAGLFEQVQRRFSGYSQVRVVKGMLPECLAGNSPAVIAYLHIDLNDAAFEVGVLDALFARVTPGGMVILDDYEWSGPYRAQKVAEAAWFDARSYRVFPLPTGQGVVIKR